jgi:hypothetical protein
VDGAYFNLSFIIVMEDRRQKSKRLSYKGKFKREVIRCAEKGNCKAAAIFGVDESNVRLCGNTRQQSAGVRHHEGNSVDPSKNHFLKLMMQSSRFLREKQDWTVCVL